MDWIQDQIVKESKYLAHVPYYVGDHDLILSYFLEWRS
jgi:hypothetical protein